MPPDLHPAAAPEGMKFATFLDLKPVVVVVGGGVAGLTVAHELATREMSVTVIERAVGVDATGDRGLIVGGMARSQYYDARAVTNERPVVHEKPKLLPGEHGFRFFPSYYHHIWDTLQRIPVRDAAGHPTGRRVYDNIVPCTAQGWTGGPRGPVVFSRRPIQDVTDIAWSVQQALLLGVTIPDMEASLLRILRYMCTSSARRAAECEDISAMAWLTGARSLTEPDRITYSPSFKENMEIMPVVLAAFDASRGDARTNLNHLIQLAMPLLRSQPKVDGTLNGPTSEAWFQPWRAHLEALGVRFVCGEALPLELAGEGTARPGVSLRYQPIDPATGRATGEPVPIAASYIVVATDAPAAEQLSALLPKVGVPRALQGFTTTVPPDPVTGAPGRASRDPYVEPGLTPWDRFQTLTGIQYFFDTELTLLHGHLYFMGSDWALTGIAQQTFWTAQPTMCSMGYTSVLSVDIGDWRNPSKETNKAAFESTVEEIGAEVWRQIAESLAPGHADQIPMPRAFVIDEFIERDSESGLPVRNLAPYLIPMVTDFPRRPGGEPWNPTSCKPGRREPPEEGVWQADHGGQLVHWDRVIYAGVWLKTFTRLTSMEAACESGRHAVNALLDHEAWRMSKGKEQRPWPGVRWSAPPGFLDSQNRTPIAQPGPLGDYCMIWDMEENEPRDLLSARAIDEAMFRAGLPHPWELLGIDRATEAIAWLNRVTPAAGPPPTTPEDLGAALRSSVMQSLQTLAELAKVQNDLLTRLLRRP